jgi:pimeloyl-ACP methyl ester carboxylesterase
VSSSYLLLGDLRAHYLGWNLEGDGRPAVLLHGLASNARIWELTAPYMADAGLRLLAPDLRGHGLTDKPDGDHTFDVYARDLAAFLSLLELERPLLVGHSWGAMLALDYAARFPVGPRSPAGLVLVDGGLNQLDDFPGATWEGVRERLAPPRLAGIPLDDFLQRLRSPNPRWQLDERAEQIILANFEIAEDETIYPRLAFERHMQIVRAMWEFPTYSRFAQVCCPVLALPARSAPPLSPPEQEFLERKQSGAEKVLDANPGVRLHWMEDAIHDLPLQQPQALADLILDFERSLPA